MKRYLLSLIVVFDDISSFNACMCVSVRDHCNLMQLIDAMQIGSTIVCCIIVKIRIGDDELT